MDGERLRITEEPSSVLKGILAVCGRLVHRNVVVGVGVVVCNMVEMKIVMVSVMVVLLLV